MTRAKDKIFSFNGETYSYQIAHIRMRKWYGHANHCEGKNCSGKSRQFDWANISGEYKLVLDDWLQLCRSCHKKFDLDDNMRNVLSKNRDVINNSKKKPIRQCSLSGELVKVWPSRNEAARTLQFNPGNLLMALKYGRQSYGFKWYYDYTNKVS